MQIPSARTFVAGETETAAFMNSVGAAVNFLLNPPRCSASQQSSVQTLTTATWAAITFDTEDYDTDTMHNNTTNPSRFTANTAGLYELRGYIFYSSNATGVRYAQLRKNAAGSSTGGTELLTEIFNAVGTSTSTRGPGASKEVYLAAGDYVELFGYQNSGASLALLAGSSLSARWVANS